MHLIGLTDLDRWTDVHVLDDPVGVTRQTAAGAGELWRRPLEPRAFGRINTKQSLFLKLLGLKSGFIFTLMS